MLDLAIAATSAPREFASAMRWPKFSITSFVMVSSLRRQGVLPRHVIDVGANEGQFAIACAKLFPSAHVHAFEPIPACAARLRTYTARLRNTTVHELALGESAGTLSFHVNRDSRASSALPLGDLHRAAFPHAAEAEVITVPVSTLDEVFGGVDLQGPVLLKLDVQGFEAHTLRGGTETLRRVQYALLETSFRPMYEGETPFLELARLLEERGFRFLRPVGWLASPQSGEILQMDALFERVGN